MTVRDRKIGFLSVGDQTPKAFRILVEADVGSCHYARRRRWSIEPFVVIQSGFRIVLIAFSFLPGKLRH